MSSSPRLAQTSLIVLLLVSGAFAQTELHTPANRSTVNVTASATSEHVRFTAPSTIVQMHLQVYADGGHLLFDVTSLGNVLDWTVQDGAGVRLSSGSYLCVVTVKALSGRLSQRVGTVKIEEKQVQVESVEASQLSKSQQFAVGPLEENAGLTVLSVADPAVSTVVANDGEDGHIARSRGALTFRVGDFFSGFDREQMRLTEEGNLGIGTTQPRAKVDIEGMLRTQGIEFPDGTLQTSGFTGRKDKRGNFLPLVAGTGTTNRVAKWTDNAGTLGDSTITEINGRIGIGVANPTYRLVVGPDIGPGLIRSDLTVSRGPGLSVGAYVGPTGARGMEFGWDEPNSRAFVNAPDGTPVTFTHGGVNERMRITGLGDIGMGTSTPTSKLDVAGIINTSTQYNIAGNRVLSIPGSENTFVGINAGTANSTGGGNSFYGHYAGVSNTVGSANAFFGGGAGYNNTLGSSNSFFGGGAGTSNTEGQLNSFFGFTAGSNNTTGSSNSFFGEVAGSQNKTGCCNSFFGEASGFLNIAGQNNAFFGFQSGYKTLTSNNAFFGSNAGHNNSAGSNNIAIGSSAGFSLINGSNNVYIANVGADESNRIRIGTQGTQINTFLAGISGVPVAGDPVFVTTAGQLGTGSPSSQRFKQDIRAMGSASTKLMQLRPVVFNYRPGAVAGDSTLQYGLIAEDVAKVYPNLVSFDVNGKPLTVRYHLLNAMLLNELQKQQAQIESQRQREQVQADELVKQARKISDLEMRLNQLEEMSKRKLSRKR